MNRRGLLLGAGAAAVAGRSQGDIAPQLSVFGPVEGIVHQATGAITVSIANAKAGVTYAVTPTAAFAGSFSPPKLSLSAGSPSATVTFTPVQQGPANAISAAGDNGALSAAPFNLAVYSAVTAGSAVTLAAPADLTFAGFDKWSDAILSVVDAGDGSKYFFGSNAGQQNPPGRNIRVTGTVSRPIPIGNATTVLSTIGGLKRPSDYHASGHIIKDLPGTAPGTWILIYHAEHWPVNGTYTGNRSGNANRFWTSLAMAVSTDLGVTWTDCGDIIYPNVPFPVASCADPPIYSPGFGTGNWACDIGDGGYVLWNDGYLYVYHLDVLRAGAGSQGHVYLPGSTQWLCVSRCLIADVAGAINAGNAPAFRKYYNGGFSQDAIVAQGATLQGGLASPLEAGNPVHFWWGTAQFHTDTNIILVTGSIGNPFGIGDNTPTNPSGIVVTQAFSPTGPFAAPQWIDRETSGLQSAQPTNPSLWSDISDGNGRVSNANLWCAWNRFPAGGGYPCPLMGCTVSLDTTGHH